MYSEQKIDLKDTSTNCILGSYVTAYARQILDNLVQEIVNTHNGRILYLDTGKNNLSILI